MRHKTRGDLWFRERGRCLRDANGVLLRVTGATREITDEKPLMSIRNIRISPRISLGCAGLVLLLMVVGGGSGVTRWVWIRGR